jgi:mono/diheme cytochrome c family protein
MRHCLLPALLFLGAIAAAAAAHDWKTDTRGVLLPIARAPEKARARKNPYPGQADAALTGAKLFRQHCASCHGQDARGLGQAANLRSPDIQRATPGELEWFLRNGNLAAGMPPWSGLPEQRRWQIVAYLKTLR